MSLQPIIIKRKRVVAGEAHHGGAWKVAYADFVTAMMAFFLLMWLLNATTEEQRRGIADYFDPSIPVAAVSGGGADLLSGDTVYATDSLSSSNHGGEQSNQVQDTTLVAEIKEALEDAIAEEQVRVSLSDEGVVVELLEAEGAPLFALGNAAASPLLESAIAEIVPVLKERERRMKIVGHTDALPFRTDSSYTNWELSADRANAARRIAIGRGLPPSLVTDVIGKADLMPISDDPNAPENRRISFVLPHG